LSLLHMYRRLRMYFKAHPIKVITDQPLKQILSKAQASRKLAKYSVELGAYNIAYEPRHAIKGQVLVEFLSKALVGTPPKDFFCLPTQVQSKVDVERWTIFTDKASNSKGFDVDLVLISPSGIEFTYALRLNFTSKNNEAGYEALLVGLRLAEKMKANYVIIEIHMGSCEMHIRARSVVAKAIKQGEDKNKDELRLNMDLLQERREAKYKTKMEQYYNQTVRLMSFKPDEYVFQRNEASRVEDQGKLRPKWEGSYRVTKAYQNGSYKLQTMGEEVPRT
nr:putative reverse transcriptase domain, ribonuclease H-like domain protein [Tanacetum cinerariifolium]